MRPRWALRWWYWEWLRFRCIGQWTQRRNGHRNANWVLRRWPTLWRHWIILPLGLRLIKWWKAKNQSLGYVVNVCFCIYLTDSGLSCWQCMCLFVLKDHYSSLLASRSGPGLFSNSDFLLSWDRLNSLRPLSILSPHKLQSILLPNVRFS